MKQPMAKHKALVAAIDHYPNPSNNLPSCLADARAMERMLRSVYKFTDIRTLLDGDASLANVEAGLDWLFARAAPDDRLVFFFSGHGFQVRRGENLDEVLCLHDKFLFDDALSQRTQSLPPGIFSLVSDSCHSGGLYKIMVDTDSAHSVQVAQTKVMRIPPAEEADKVFVSSADVRSLRYRPFGFRVATLAAAAKRFNMALPKGFDEGGDLAMNGLLLSACLENETASASTPKTNGMSAFTFALTQQIEVLGPDVSNAKLVEGVTKALQALGFRQTPVMMEAPLPSGLGNRSFLTLAEVKSAAAGTAGEPGDAKFPVPTDDLQKIINDAIGAIRAA